MFFFAIVFPVLTLAIFCLGLFVAYRVVRRVVSATLAFLLSLASGLRSLVKRRVAVPVAARVERDLGTFRTSSARGYATR